MVKALQCIIKKELRRGWLAWTLEMKRKERKLILDSYTEFQGLRYLSKALKNVSNLALKKKWVIWVNATRFVRFETRGLSEFTAVVQIQKIGRGFIARLKVNYIKDMTQFSALHEAIICLQKLFRGKVVFWKYQKYLKKKLQNYSAVAIQKEVRLMRNIDYKC